MFHIYGIPFTQIPNTIKIHIKYSPLVCFTFLLRSCVPEGDGPLPEVGAIPGQPTKETKQALYILQGTKIEEQLVSRRKRNSCYTVKNSYFYLILAKRP